MYNVYVRKLPSIEGSFLANFWLKHKTRTTIVTNNWKQAVYVVFDTNSHCKFIYVSFISKYVSAWFRFKFARSHAHFMHVRLFCCYVQSKDCLLTCIHTYTHTYIITYLLNAQNSRKRMITMMRRSNVVHSLLRRSDVRAPHVLSKIVHRNNFELLKVPKTTEKSFWVSL